MDVTRKQPMFLAGIVFAAAISCSIAMNTESNAASPAAPGAMPKSQVGVITVVSGKAELSDELSGRTSPYLISEVRPQVGGIVKQRLFTEGADVAAGDVLYEIDPATYQVAYDSARAALGKAQANVDSVRAKASRYKELVAINAVSKQDYDDATAALKSAVADVDTAKAALEAARINLGYTKVTSPITGRIGRSSVTPGALVTASQAAPLVTVQQLDPIYVDVTQTSREMLRLKKELASGRIEGGADTARVKLTLEDGSEYPHEGTLQFSDVTVEQSTGSVALRAVFPNPDHTLMPGMYVRAEIQEGHIPDAILVPQKAVTRDASGAATAMIVSSEGKVELRQLVVDRAIGNSWLVSGGLKAGDRLIVSGLQKIRPGADVEASEEAPEASQQK